MAKSRHLLSGNQSKMTRIRLWYYIYQQDRDRRSRSLSIVEEIISLQFVSNYFNSLSVVIIEALADGKGQISVWIHHVSKRHSQSPFKKVKGAVQKVLFHPYKSLFFVAVGIPFKIRCWSFYWQTYRLSSTLGSMILRCKSLWRHCSLVSSGSQRSIFILRETIWLLLGMIGNCAGSILS